MFDKSHNKYFALTFALKNCIDIYRQEVNIII